MFNHKILDLLNTLPQGVTSSDKGTFSELTLPSSKKKAFIGLVFGIVILTLIIGFLALFFTGKINFFDGRCGTNGHRHQCGISDLGIFILAAIALLALGAYCVYYSIKAFLSKVKVEIHEDGRIRLYNLIFSKIADEVNCDPTESIRICRPYSSLEESDKTSPHEEGQDLWIETTHGTFITCTTYPVNKWLENVLKEVRNQFSPDVEELPEQPNPLLKKLEEKFK